MYCPCCKNDTAYNDVNSEVVELGENALLVIRNIPCRKCRECSEIIYSGDVVRRIEILIEKAREAMQDLSIVDFSKVA
jgi:YgiT-type zinc finger domain-containing protein